MDNGEQWGIMLPFHVGNKCTMDDAWMAYNGASMATTHLPKDWAIPIRRNLLCA